MIELPIQPSATSPYEQLVLYARDLRRSIARERQKSADLKMACSQLAALSARLDDALASERENSKRLEQAHQETVMRLIHASRFKDEETGAHIQRVSRYAHKLALAVGLSAERAELLAAAAPMHDIGKIGLSDLILQKPGPLTPEERRLMETHTLMGADLLSGSASPLLQTARSIALTHHERWDGSGYPNHLRGPQIPVEGRILMIADQYDALRSARRYKPAFDHAKTCMIILEGDGRTMPQHFDPAILEVFRRIRDDFCGIYEQCQDEET